MFENDKEKQDALNYLTQLKEHTGWRLIEKAIEKKAQHYTDQLREKKDFQNLEELYYLQKRIEDLEEFKQFPDILLAAAQEDPAEPEEEEIY